LQCDTPAAWVDDAKKPENLPIVLLDHLVCELKAAQSALFLIRKYAVDAASGDALLAWLKPYEDFTYRQIGDWRQLARGDKLSKQMIARSDSPYSDELIDAYAIKTVDGDVVIKSLSGGNLQKFIVGREIEAKPKLLIVSQPTWGVDVGAAAQIRGEILKLRDAGCAVLVVTHDPRLAADCARTIQLVDGRIVSDQANPATS